MRTHVVRAHAHASMTPELRKEGGIACSSGQLQALMQQRQRLSAGFQQPRQAQWGDANAMGSERGCCGWVEREPARRQVGHATQRGSSSCGCSCSIQLLVQGQSMLRGGCTGVHLLIRRAHVR